MKIALTLVFIVVAGVIAAGCATFKKMLENVDYEKLGNTVGKGLFEAYAKVKESGKYEDEVVKVERLYKRLANMEEFSIEDLCDSLDKVLTTAYEKLDGKKIPAIEKGLAALTDVVELLDKIKGSEANARAFIGGLKNGIEKAAAIAPDVLLQAGEKKVPVVKGYTDGIELNQLVDTHKELAEALINYCDRDYVLEVGETASMYENLTAFIARMEALQKEGKSTTTVRIASYELGEKLMAIRFVKYAPVFCGDSFVEVKKVADVPMD